MIFIDLWRLSVCVGEIIKTWFFQKKKLALSYRSYITSSNLDSKILTLIFLKILTIESLSYLRGSLGKWWLLATVDSVMAFVHILHVSWAVIINWINKWISHDLKNKSKMLASSCLCQKKLFLK